MGEYKNLLPYQSKTLKEVDFSDIATSLAEAGRTEDIYNTSLEFFDDNNRMAGNFLKVSYDNSKGIENLIIETETSKRTIPLMQKEQLNMSGLKNALKQAISQYGNTPVYMDNDFLREKELEDYMKMTEEEDIVIEDKNYMADAPEIPDIPEFIREQMEEEQHTQEQSHEDALLKEPISIDKVTNYEKRAFLDIDRFLEEMKKEGFQTTIGANGNIIVQSENMSPENRIEITSDNNIIEKANLTTEEEKSLFEGLSDSVKEKTDEISREFEGEADELKNSPLHEIMSSQQILDELVMEYATDLNLGSIDMDKKLEYVFFTRNEKGKEEEFLSLSLEYETNDPENPGRIAVRYGKEFGGYEEILPIKKEDISAAYDWKLMSSELGKRVEQLASLATKDRISILESIRGNRFDRKLSDVLQNEFKMNKEQIDYFKPTILQAYEEKKSISESLMNAMKQAYFAKPELFTENNLNSFREGFSKIEDAIHSFKPKEVEISTLDLNDMTLKGYENDVEFLNTKESSLFQCDREWLQKLGRLEDNLVALKHNAIPAIQESAKKLLKNSVELRDGIAKPYKAGLLSGVELGGGIESIRDGLKLANIMKNKEKEYENSKKEDSFKALEQKLDLKLTHDEIIKNTNIYTRNAYKLKMAIDTLLHEVKATKQDAFILADNNQPATQNFPATNKIADWSMANHARKINGIHGQIKEIFSELVKAFKEIAHGFNLIGKGSKEFAIENYEKASQIVSNKFQAISEKTAKDLQDFRDSYNKFIDTLSRSFDYKVHTQEFLASRLNDNAVERAFLNTKEEILPLKNRLLWEELELSVKNGKLAEKIPEAERTEEEQSNIIEGNFAKKKIEQNTFIADRLVDSIEKALNNKDLSRNDAIISIAEDYHKAAMGYNVMNGAESITTFDNLSPSEKSDCINIIEKVLDDIPQFDKEFQSREESVPNIEQSAPER